MKAEDLRSIKIGKTTFFLAKEIKALLQNKYDPKLFNEVFIMYQSRFLGLCFSRRENNKVISNEFLKNNPSHIKYIKSREWSKNDYKKRHRRMHNCVHELQQYLRLGDDKEIDVLLNELIKKIDGNVINEKNLIANGFIKTNPLEGARYGYEKHIEGDWYYLSYYPYNYIFVNNNEGIEFHTIEEFKEVID